MSQLNDKVILKLNNKNRILNEKLSKLLVIENPNHQVLYKIKKYNEKIKYNNVYIKNINEFGYKKAKGIMYTFKKENCASIYYFDSEYKKHRCEKKIERLNSKLKKISNKENEEKIKEVIVSIKF